MTQRMRKLPRLNLPSLEKFPSDAVLLSHHSEEELQLQSWYGTVMHPEGTVRLHVTRNKGGKPSVTLSISPPGDFRSPGKKLSDSLSGKGPRTAQVNIWHDNERGTFKTRKIAGGTEGKNISVSAASPKATYLAYAMRKIIPRLRLDPAASDRHKADWEDALQQLRDIYDS